MDAPGKYVKDDLSPVIMDSLRKRGFKDDFLLEAMSTTHVRKGVMSYFSDKIPQIRYERVSFYPINKENIITPFHKSLLENSLNLQQSGI